MQMDRLSASAEEACFNAWPALKEIFYDGWLIRLANGETRRTNSVNVIGRSAYALDEKIAHCQRIYSAHGQPTYFRIRSCDDPVLEDALEAHGYRAEDDTRTLFMDFGATPPETSSRSIEIVEGLPGEGMARRAGTLFRPRPGEKRSAPCAAWACRAPHRLRRGTRRQWPDRLRCLWCDP